MTACEYAPNPPAALAAVPLSPPAAATPLPPALEPLLAPFPAEDAALGHGSAVAISAQAVAARGAISAKDKAFAPR